MEKLGKFKHEKKKDVSSSDAEEVRSEVSENSDTPQKNGADARPPAAEDSGVSVESKEQISDLVRELVRSDDSDFLAKMANHRNWRIRLAVALNKNTPIETLKKLAGDNDERVVTAVAETVRQSDDSEFLTEMADQQHWLIRATVALNKNTPIETLKKLAEDNDERVLGAVIVRVRQSDDAEFLAAMANHEDLKFRAAVVLNENTPTEVFKKLTGDENERICAVAYYTLERRGIPDCVDGEGTILHAMYVLNHPAVETEELVKAANDKNVKSNDNFILSVILMHKKIPSEILVQHIPGENEDIRAVIPKAPKYIREAASQAPKHVRKHVRKYDRNITIQNFNYARDVALETLNSRTEELRHTESVVDHFPVEGDIETRLTAARSVRTPPKELHMLAEDPDEEVRLALAYNIMALPETLVKLAGDKSNRVCTTVALRADTPPEALVVAAKGENVNIHFILVLRGNTPPEALASLVRSESVRVRLQLIVHKNTQIETLKKIAKEDKDRVIRLAARDRLDVREGFTVNPDRFSNFVGPFNLGTSDNPDTSIH